MVLPVLRLDMTLCMVLRVLQLEVTVLYGIASVAPMCGPVLYDVESIAHEFDPVLYYVSSVAPGCDSGQRH